MPGSYLIDLPRRIVFSRGWGVLTDMEIGAHAETLRADPRFDPGFRQIANFLELTQVRVTAEGVRNVALHNPFRPEARRAFAVPSDETFGLTRMFELYTDSHADQFGIFRALGPAMEWLGLDSMTPWPVQPPDKIFTLP